MAFFGRVGNILRQAANKQLSSELRSASSIFQAIRCMSSAASSRVFVGGLSYNTDEQSLREAFAKYGEVVDARVIMDRETNRSRGFAFVTFTSVEEASSSIQALDGQDLDGRQVRVNYANERPRYGGGAGAGYGGGYGNSLYGGSGAYGGNAAGGYGGGGYGGGSYVSGGSTGNNYASNNFGAGAAGSSYGNDDNFASGTPYGGGSDGGYGGSSGSGTTADSFGTGSAVGGFGGSNYAKDGNFARSPYAGGSSGGYGSNSGNFGVAGGGGGSDNYGSAPSFGSAVGGGSDSFGGLADFGSSDGPGSGSSFAGGHNGGIGSSGQLDGKESDNIGQDIGDFGGTLEENFRDDDAGNFAKRA